ncbi:MAG: hypothetical protein ACPLRN_02615 [Microgenomates group bacterium]
MLKKILIIIITGLLVLIFVSRSVFSAEKISGSSAQIAKNQPLNKKININQFNIKKLVIRKIFEKYQSPLLGQEKYFVYTCEKYQLDCYLLPSIAGLESTFGKFIYPNSYNPFGWGGGYIIFGSWQEAIDAVGKGLRSHYYNKGATDVWSIGPIYSESPTWAQRVDWFMEQFKKEEEKIPLLPEDFPVKL